MKRVIFALVLALGIVSVASSIGCGPSSPTTSPTKTTGAK
jgi:hypothetical protein